MNLIGPSDFRARIQGDQMARLRRYLRRTVLPFSEHYRRVFREHSLLPEDMRTFDDLSQIPFASKEDLAGSPANPATPREFVLLPDRGVLAKRPSILLQTLLRGRAAVLRNLEREFRPVFMTSTTGRSADPVPFLYTVHDLNRLSLAGARLFEVCGATPEMKVLNMFPYAPHLGFWLAVHGGAAAGVFTLSSGGGKVMGTEGQLRFLQKLQPHVLIGMPTFMYHVLHEAAAQSLRLPTLCRIVLGGEKVPDGLRRKLASLAAECGAPSVEVLATYGFTEAKMAWAECPHPVGAPSPGYHLFPDMGIVEVVAPDTGTPLPPGHAGEIVFTPLDARGTVVLRYRTGDLIDGGLHFTRCPRCGREVPRLLGHISRRSGMQAMHLDKLKGTLVDFNVLEHILDDLPGVGAWQIELRKLHDDPLELDEIILHIAPIGDATEAQLVHRIDSQFARVEVHPNRIHFHEAGELRRMQGVGAELKERRLVDHRPSAAMTAPTSSIKEVRR